MGPIETIRCPRAAATPGVPVLELDVLMESEECSQAQGRVPNRPGSHGDGLALREITWETERAMQDRVSATTREKILMCAKERRGSESTCEYPAALGASAVRRGIWCEAPRVERAYTCNLRKGWNRDAELSDVRALGEEVCNTRGSERTGESTGTL